MDKHYRDFELTITKTGYPPDVGYKGIAGMRFKKYIFAYGETLESVYQQLKNKIDRWYDKNEDFDCSTG